MDDQLQTLIAQLDEAKAQLDRAKEAHRQIYNAWRPLYAARLVAKLGITRDQIDHEADGTLRMGYTTLDFSHWVDRSKPYAEFCGRLYHTASLSPITLDPVGDDRLSLRLSDVPPLT
jgi:hypothetical protein